MKLLGPGITNSNYFTKKNWKNLLLHSNLSMGILHDALIFHFNHFERSAKIKSLINI